MAITTRFISTSDTPFVPNPNKMDPGAASAAAKAQEGAASAISKSLNELAVSFDKSQEKVDDLYAANAKANLEVDYNKSFMEASGQLKPNGNFGMDSLKMLQDMSKPYIDNAPNDATRQALIKSFIGFGKSAQVRGDTKQFKFNEKHDLQGLSDYATKSAALLAMGQVGEEKAYANLESIAAGLSEKGYDQDKIQKMVGGAKDQVWLQSRLTDATKNPFEVLKAAKSGAYAEKGLQAQQHIIQAANTAISANVEQATTAANELLNSIYDGVPGSPQLPDMLKTMSSLAVQTQDPKLAKTLAELDQANKFDLLTRNKSLEELQSEQIQLQRQAASGEMVPGQLEKLQGVLANRISWAQKDKLGYYLMQNPTVALSPLPSNDDYRKLNQASQSGDPKQLAAAQDNINSKLMQRIAIAGAAGEIQGTTVPYLTAPELTNTFKNWNQMTTDQRYGQLLAFRGAGADQVGAISRMAQKILPELKDKALDAMIPAINLLQVPGSDALVKKILVGNDHLSKGTVELNVLKGTQSTIINDALGSLYANNPALQEQYLAAAKAVVASDLASNPKDRTTALNPGAAITQALKDISGVVDGQIPGTLFGHNSYKVIPPEQGMSSDTFKKLVGDMTMADVAKYGSGIPSVQAADGSLRPINNKDPSDYKFVSVGGGRYILDYNGAGVVDETGNLLTVNLREYWQLNKSKYTK